MLKEPEIPEAPIPEQPADPESPLPKSLDFILE